MNRRQFLQLTGLTAGVLALPKVAQASGALKCVAGWPGWTRCQSVGASFGYQWDNLDATHGKIPHVKVGWDKPWTGEAAIRTAARSGSIMICNELSLGTTVDVQVDVLRRLFDVVLDENPACYVLGPNDIIWCPQKGWTGYHNIGNVANRYLQRYGVLPPFKGFGFHAYHWPGGANLTNVIYWTAERARQVYGSSIDLHITETGSLVSQQAAIDSIPMIQDGLGVGIAAYFWFVTQGDSRCQIWDSAWNLTQVGRAFRGM